MKTAYPVIITKSTDYYLVDVPDLNGQTQGKSFYEAIVMARDLIGSILVDLEDENREIPTPSDSIDIKTNVFADVGHGKIAFVDVDTNAYRIEISDKKSVRRNVTLPEWLDKEARKAKINVSKVVQEALSEQLGIALK